jgi:hypothetical protein
LESVQAGPAISVATLAGFRGQLVVEPGGAVTRTGRCEDWIVVDRVRVPGLIELSARVFQLAFASALLRSGWYTSAPRQSAKSSTASLRAVGHDRAFLRALAAARGELLSEATQIAVDAEVPEDVVRALHQQRAQHGIAGLGYSKLWVFPAGLIATWHEPDVRTDSASILEARRIADRQHEAQRRHGADTFDLPQQLRLRVPLPPDARSPGRSRGSRATCTRGS